jgi:hypothetical protein
MVPARRFTSNLTLARLSISASYKPDAAVTLNRETMLDLLELVVELARAQR